MDIGIFPAAVWGALLGASISYPLFTLFDTLKERAEKGTGKDSIGLPTARSPLNARSSDFEYPPF